MQVRARIPETYSLYIPPRRSRGHGRGRRRRDPDESARLTLARELPYQVNLGLPVRCSVGAQDFVEPHRRLLHNVGTLPRIPRQVSLRFARDETPVDRPNALLLGDRQNRIKSAALRTRHVLRANYRPVVFLSEPYYLLLERLRPVIVMKGDNVGLTQLDLLDLAQVAALGRSIYGPHTAGERLRGICFPCPRERLRQKRRYSGDFVLFFKFFVGVGFAANSTRLIPDIPGEDAVVIGERSHHAHYV